MYNSFANLLSRFDIRHSSENSYQAICPAHEDTNPSLSISIEDGKALLHCHAGCSVDDILSKVSLKMSDLFRDIPALPIPAPKIIYDYFDVDGKKVHSTIKSYKDGKKSFRQVSYQNGKEVHSLKGIQPIIYNLPNVLSSIQKGDPIYIVEGEKDADTLIKSGLTATTNPMGAGKWKSEYSKYFRDADVIIIPDNDKPGKEHATHVGVSLRSSAKSIKIIELPNLGHSEDVSDWLAKGKTIYNLMQIIEVNPYFFSRDQEFNERFTFLSEAWMADRIAEKYEGIILYNHTSGKWLIWENNIWIPDRTMKINELVKLFIAEIVDEYQNEKSFRGKCNALSKRSAINSIIELTKSNIKIARVDEDFDYEPGIFNLKNGYFNFNDMKFYSSDPQKLSTKQAVYSYMKDAECPNWLKFLNVIFDGHQDLMEYVQKMIGYSLQGRVLEELMLFCYGTGKNGKSIFFNIIEKLCGDYAQKIPTETLTQKTSDSISNDIARLNKVRLAIAAEWPENKRLNEALIKDLTGGDKKVARFLYEEYFEFTPSLTLWMYGNHKPHIVGTDYGIWRRIKLIPFTVTISVEQYIPKTELLNSLESELPGIFNWAIEGWALYKAEAYTEPDIVKISIDNFKSESNTIISFLDEKCEIGSYESKALDIYIAYEKWALENKEVLLTKQTFYKRLKEMGYEDSKMPKGHYKTFKGLRVKGEEND